MPEGKQAQKEEWLAQVKEWEGGTVLEALGGKGAPDPSCWGWGSLLCTLLGRNPEGAFQLAQKAGIPGSFPSIARGLALPRHLEHRF